jgi:hypothetical protein
VSSSTESAILAAIPDPDSVRERLAQIARERSLLKGLLRLAQRKAQASKRRDSARKECSPCPA